MEGVGVNRIFWQGKRVFLTGHTGFKGGWLSLWLSEMGAEVYGYALEANDHSYFTITKLPVCLTGNTIADIRDATTLTFAMQAAQPDIVLHLAAQSQVRYSYNAPAETYATNVMGTINLFEATRQTPSVKAIVNVTSDKCYENREWCWPYRENDAMGGFDPYSNSKACSELVTTAYRSSFFESKGIYLASARAGNVIGGGDWATDRLVPDFLRALDANQHLTIRSPYATRPWQHVLEPLAGYLMLAEKLYTEGKSFAQAWNFGPQDTDARSVQWIVEYLCNKVEGVAWQCDSSSQSHEANMLKLDSSKVKAQLGWYPRLKLQTALDMTLAWHQAWKQGLDMADFSIQQIGEYEKYADDHD